MASNNIESINTHNIRDEFKTFTVDEVKEIYEKNSINVSVLCLNLTSEHNLGTIVRTSSLYGFKKIYIVGKRHYNKIPAVGMYNYIPVERIQATEGAHNDKLNNKAIIGILDDILNSDNQLIFIEQCPNSIPLTSMVENITSSKPVVFVFGNESTGIPNEIIDYFVKKACLFIEIPQYGVCRSHNVSSALSIVGWEYIRHL